MANEKKAPATADKKAEGDPGPAVTKLRISARHDGFRRAGRAWSKEPTTVSVDEFTEDQLQMLYLEPMLLVMAVADEA